MTRSAYVRDQPFSRQTGGKWERVHVAPVDVEIQNAVEKLGVI